MGANKIVDVLGDFNVDSAEDFGRLAPGNKPIFVSRLFKASAQERRSSLADLPGLGGLKLHYAATYRQGNFLNLPQPAFIKRLLFYSNRSVISFPFQVFPSPSQLASRGRWGGERMYFGDVRPLGRRPQGGIIAEVNQAYWIDRADFDTYVNLCCRMSRLMASGYVNVVCTFPDSEKSLRRGSLGLTSANFKLQALKAQFEERPTSLHSPQRNALGVAKLLLPHFSMVPVERLIEIREREAERYTAFQRMLERLLYDSAETSSEEKLLYFLGEVDEGVREIDAEFRKIQRDFQRRNVSLMVKFLAAGLVLLAPIDAKELIGGLVGGMSSMDYISNIVTLKEERGKALESEFYLPWLVART